MNSCSIVIQGEGKGHFSQAITFMEIMEKRGVEVKRVYIGRSLFKPLSEYFKLPPTVSAASFLGPWFLRTPDRRGIQIMASLVINLLLSPLYIFESCRIGIMMRQDGSDTMVNFYDPVGAVAGRWWKRGAKRVVISHHFYLSHPAFIHPHGLERSYFWLQLMNRIMMRSAHQVIALSFRKEKPAGRISVTPPLIDMRVKRGEHKGIGKDLCYFLSPGFVEDALNYYRNHPSIKADIFTNELPLTGIPANVELHLPSRKAFLAAILHCNRMICTAGFDTVAEAFFLGIPVFVIPTENHYEQYCNAIDAARTGMAFQLEELTALDEVEFIPSGNRKYREWADSVENSLMDIFTR